MRGNCLLDLGNTRYKWMMQSALPDGKIAKAIYAESMPADAVLRDLLGQQCFERLIVASVKSPAFNRAFSEACRKANVVVPEFISIEDQALIPLAYQDISRFGIDRYLDLVGALQRYQPPFIVVDAGTVVTFDAVNTVGTHMGGCIYPGRKLLSASLIEGTDGIYMKQQGRSTVFADSTEAGVNGGVEQGFVAAVDGVLVAMQSEFNHWATVVLTGGDADWLSSRLGTSTVMDSTILFEGIKHAQNSSGVP